MSSLSPQSPDQSSDVSDSHHTVETDQEVTNLDDQQALIELQHDGHEHLLNFFSAVELEKCALCQQRIYVAEDVYSCTTCFFFLHKSCAESPRYIHNYLHPMHTLQLIFVAEGVYTTMCSLCEEALYRSGYECNRCEFTLHIECAMESMYDPKDHQHAFVNFKPTFFTCNACGIDEHDTKCFSWICSICQLQVHRGCVKLFPFAVSVRQRMHSHELELCYSFEIDFDFASNLCKICSQKMSNVLFLYRCKDGCVSYFTHAKCATSWYYMIDDLDLKRTGHSTSNEELEQKEIDTVITHFSHPHSLNFSNIMPEDDVPICHGCVRPISAPFYTCDSEQCKFFLHKQCAELPETVLSPLHQHPLELRGFPDLYMSDIIFHGFTCGACQVRCNGFAYVCTMCNVTFDVECSSFGDTLNHESHKCTLRLVTMTPNDQDNRCIACGSTISTAFWCEECNFFLDLNCASFPTTFGHDCPTGTVWSIKPLKLWYDCIEHKGGQYYCDLCGETRGKDLWFYHCEDCRDSIHPQCLLGDDRFMCGKSYNLDGHCHTIRVEKKPKTDPLCDTCGKPCQHSPLVFCPTCKVYIHDDLSCCGMLESSRYNRIENYCCGISSSEDSSEDGNDNDNDNENDQPVGFERNRLVRHVNHFIHPHSLIIGEQDRDILHKEVCDACGMPISAPYYTCSDKKGRCNFFLHRKCFRLPKQIQHPLHPDHPLDLISLLDLPGHDGVGFICYGCDAFSNGFAYTCLACKFFLEVGCSLLSDTLVHETHPCTLTLVDKNIQPAKGEGKCNACNAVCSSCRYSCDGCNFELDLHCASLPKVIHDHPPWDWNIRPRHLMYVAGAIKDGSGNENYCYLCKDRIGENEWYYCCEDHDSSTHVRCTTIRTKLIKNRVVYQAYNHFHNLATVKIDASRFECCHVCKALMGHSPAVYCKKCRVYLHVKCCRWLRRV